MKEYPKIAAITINYATADDTLECIKSLKEQSYPNLEIIVIDNHSPDHSGEMLYQQLHDTCQFILSKENGGFSAGNNLGIDLALQHGAEYLLFINNDTVQDPDMVMNLYQESCKGNIAIPKTYYFSEKSVLWDVGSSLSKFGRIFNRGLDEEDHGQYDHQEEVDLFSGHCLLMPVSCIEKAGKWKESYFMYVEDTEYAIRIKAHGYRIIYVPTAKLWHKVSKSSGGVQNPRTMYYTIRNRLYLLEAFPKPHIIRIYQWIWIASCQLRYLFLRKQTFRYTIRAVSDYFKGITGRVDFDDK